MLEVNTDTDYDKWKTKHDVMRWWIDMTPNEYNEFLSKMRKVMVDQGKQRYLKYLRQ